MNEYAVTIKETGEYLLAIEADNMADAELEAWEVLTNMSETEKLRHFKGSDGETSAVLTAKKEGV